MALDFRTLRYFVAVAVAEELLVVADGARSGGPFTALVAVQAGGGGD